MESQIRATSLKALCFLALHFLLHPPAFGSRWIGPEAGWQQRCLPLCPHPITPPTHPTPYLLAGQRGGLGADWQSLCSPSKTLKVDFIPMKNPLRVHLRAQKNETAEK